MGAWQEETYNNCAKLPLSVQVTLFSDAHLNCNAMEISTQVILVTRHLDTGLSRVGFIDLGQAVSASARAFSLRCDCSSVPLTPPANDSEPEDHA